METRPSARKAVGGHRLRADFAAIRISTPYRREQDEGLLGRIEAPKFIVTTHTAAAAANERSRQLARIGSNLNQIARWANTYKRKAAAVQVIGHLSTIEREMHNLRIRGGTDAD